MFHFTIASLVAKPLNRNEAKGDPVMIQTLLFFKCKLLCYQFFMENCSENLYLLLFYIITEGSQTLGISIHLLPNHHQSSHQLQSHQRLHQSQ